MLASFGKQLKMDFKLQIVIWNYFLSFLIFYINYNICFSNSSSIVNKDANFLKVSFALIYNKLTFITFRFGQHNMSNIGSMRKFLTALSRAVPYAKVVIGISDYSKISTNFVYPLRIEFFPFAFKLSIKPDQTKPYYGKMYMKIYYSYMGHFFYKKYIEEHSDLDLIMITNDDNLILKDPYDLYIKYPEKIHVMQDIRILKKKDLNRDWFLAFYYLNESIKRKCNLFSVKNYDYVMNQLPLNSGTQIAKANKILKVGTLMSNLFNCIGPVFNGGEQGLMNYLYFSGHFKSLGIDFQFYSNNSTMISCAQHIPLTQFRKIAPNLFTIHHYQKLKQNYLNYLSHSTLEIIYLKP